MPASPTLVDVPPAVLERLLPLLDKGVLPSPNGANGHAAPSPNGANGRTIAGRFAKGNRGGPGNPFARQVAAFRSALCKAVTEDDFRDMALALVVKAKCGDVAAIKVLFAYAIGKPGEAVDPDTLDWQEMQLFQRTRIGAEELQAVLNGMPPEVIAGLVRVALPCLADGVRQQLAAAVADAEPKPARQS